jgi:hypothetical protein
MCSTSLLRVGHWITTHPYPGHEVDEDPRGSPRQEVGPRCALVGAEILRRDGPHVLGQASPGRRVLGGRLRQRGRHLIGQPHHWRGGGRRRDGARRPLRCRLLALRL